MWVPFELRLAWREIKHVLIDGLFKLPLQLFLGVPRLVCPELHPGQVEELLLVDLSKTIVKSIDVVDPGNDRADEYTVDQIGVSDLTRLVPEIKDLNEDVVGRSVTGPWMAAWRAQCEAIRRSLGIADPEAEDRALALQRLDALLAASRAAEGPWPGFGASLAGVLGDCWAWELCQRRCAEARELHMKRWAEATAAASPFRWGIESWRAEREGEEAKRYDEVNRLAALRMLVEDTRPLPSGWIYRGALLWWEGAEPTLRGSLEGRCAPVVSKVWRRTHWSTASWVIESTPIVSEPGGPAKPRYTLRRSYEEHTVASSHLFFRLRLFGIRSFVWASNFARWSLVEVLGRGPLSLRALFSPSEFTPYSTVDPDTGAIVPDASRPVATFASRIRGIFADAAESRRRFEAQPDTGLLPRGITRFFNVVLNAVRVVVGTALVVAFQPALTAVATAAGLAGLVLAAPLAPVAAALWLVAVEPLLLDSLGPWTWFPLLKILLFDVGWHSVVALFRLACAAAYAGRSAVVAAGSVVLLVLRALWDGTVFHLVLARRGREPATDSIVARKVRGAEVTESLIAKLPADLALVIIQAELERLELEIYSRHAARAAVQRKSVWTETLRSVLAPFAVGVSPVGPAFEALTEEAEAGQEAVKARVKERSREVAAWSFSELIGGAAYSRHCVFGCPLEDLRVVVREAFDAVTAQWHQRILPLLEAEDRIDRELWEARRGGRDGGWGGLERDHATAFFRERQLQPGDLGALTRSLITSQLGDNFLTPLDKRDVTLVLDEPSLTVMAQRAKRPAIRRPPRLGDGMEVLAVTETEVQVDVGDDDPAWAAVVGASTKVRDPESPLPGGLLELLHGTVVSHLSGSMGSLVPTGVVRALLPSGYSASAVPPIRRFARDSLQGSDTALLWANLGDLTACLRPDLPARDFLRIRREWVQKAKGKM